MKTNRRVTVIRLLVLVVLAAGFNGKPAKAQGTNHVQGTFTLPFAARWGFATLPAGDYSFVLQGTGVTFGMLTVYRGTRSVALIPSKVVNKTESNRSELVLGGGTVRKLTLAQMGLTLEYPAPRRRAAPNEMELAQTIPVATAGPGH
jgi:hypothetical protein